MNVKDSFKIFRAEIDQELQYFFESNKTKYNNNSSFFQSFLGDIQEYTLRGGKRIRPAILYFSYQLFDVNNLDEIRKLSIYLELLQSFLLIHDDIMDKSDKRRSGKTIHKLYEEYGIKRNIIDYEHLGSSLAILSGDLACQLAFQILNQSNIDPDIKVAISELINIELIDIVYGQINDLLLGYSKEYSYEDIIDIHYYKTAKYTFELPILSTCLLIKVDNKKKAYLKNYALNAGIAYQIKDDIIGVFGEDDVTGKDNTSDISENKKTLLTLKAFENGDESQKKYMESILGKPIISKSELEVFRKIIIDTGSLEFSEKECGKFINNAKQELDNINTTKDNEGYVFLNFITEYILKRDY